MDPFDTIDVTDDGQFISSLSGNFIDSQEVEVYYEAGIAFTDKARKVLLKYSGEYLKEP